MYFSANSNTLPVSRITKQMHSDRPKLRRFALQLWAAGDLRRYAREIYEPPK